MPLPGAGCQTCKIRRIKCDETKPTCQRCTKSRRICLDSSVVKEACFSIHLENHYASGKVKRPRGPRSSLTLLRPHVDLQTQALAYYLQYHLQTRPDAPRVSAGLSECVNAWRNSEMKCPMVDLALSSIALAVYSRTQQHPPAATEAFSRYCRLLPMAQERIAHVGLPTLKGSDIDACLLAVSLMGQFEGTMHRAKENENSPTTSQQSWSHYDGAMAILKLWNDNLHDAAPTLIIKQTRRALIRTFLVRNLPLPDWMLDGTRFGERGVELEYDCVMVRMVKLHYSCLGLHNGGFTADQVEELNQEAQDVDRELQNWVGKIPNTCTFRRHSLPESGSWPRRHFYSSAVYSYCRPGASAAWCQYFALRMHINSLRLRILKMSGQAISVGSCYERQRLECMTRINAMADSLASTIPFCLERFNIENVDSSSSKPSTAISTDDGIKPYLANCLLWPLTVASRIEGINIKQQLWFRCELGILGKITGDGVLECAETDPWTFFDDGEDRRLPDYLCEWRNSR